VVDSIHDKAYYAIGSQIITYPWNSVMRTNTSVVIPSKRVLEPYPHDLALATATD